jgi:pyruvate/2-oxoglutarate dehydrogenase complex dihydrolipoamide dehydrogenase (E3) component
VELTYDGLIIASGARPRRLNGVRTLRTIDDPLALRADLASGHEHVLVIGGGFIGREVVAITALQLGRKATLVGSSLITNSRVAVVESGQVRLSNGRHIAADDEARITAGSPEEDRFAAAFTRGGVLVGAVAVNSP